MREKEGKRRRRREREAAGEEEAALFWEKREDIASDRIVRWRESRSHQRRWDARIPPSLPLLASADASGVTAGLETHQRRQRVAARSLRSAGADGGT